MRLALTSTKPGPQLTIWRDFLSLDECQQVIDAAHPRLAPSLVMNANGQGSVLDTIRTSHGAAFSRNEFPLLAEINRRASELAGRSVETFEPMQVLRYEPGQEYRAHWDYFPPEFQSSPAELARGGQRTATMLIYLRTPHGGGETTLPDAGLRVSAIAGDALYFEYPTPTQDTLTLHGGMPVTSGEKWVATIWMRERAFY